MTSSCSEAFFILAHGINNVHNLSFSLLTQCEHVHVYTAGEVSYLCVLSRRQNQVNRQQSCDKWRFLCTESALSAGTLGLGSGSPGALVCLGSPVIGDRGQGPQLSCKVLACK
jgi:hypothetical protein